MPPVVHHSRDADRKRRICLYPGDSGLLLPVDSQVDTYRPPRKHFFTSGLRIVGGSLFENKKPSIGVLPDECLFEIFKRLQGGRERSTSACVSKQWLRVMSSIRSSEFCNGGPAHQEQPNGLSVNNAAKNTNVISAYKGFKLNCDGYHTRCVEVEQGTDIKLAAIAVASSSCGGLGKVSILGSNTVAGVSNHGLSVIARSSPSLKVLLLWNVPSAGDEGLFEIARECLSLEELHLCQCPSISDSGLAAIVQSCLNLTEITIESCPHISDDGLQAIAKFCPKLKSITIKDCAFVGDQGVACLVSSASTTLSNVNLESLNITDYSVSIIGQQGKAFTSLALCGLQNVSQMGIWVMGNAQGLQLLSSLTITSCSGVTDLSLEAVGRGCLKLKHIRLCKCSAVSDTGLVAFAEATSSLRSLRLEKCNSITQIGILSVISILKSKLRTISLVECLGIEDLSANVYAELLPLLSHSESLCCLSIRCCPGFGDASLALVGKMCTQLRQLDLMRLSGITDAGLLPLLECRDEGFVKVNLSRCSNLTDKVILSLVRWHGDTLESIILDGCPKITDVSLAAIAYSCPFLIDLDVSKCSISDSGITALSRGVQINLQILSLSGCGMLTNKSIPALRTLGIMLKGLCLQQCTSISRQMIDSLRDDLQRCNVSFLS